MVKVAINMNSFSFYDLLVWLQNIFLAVCKVADRRSLRRQHCKIGLMEEFRNTKVA